MASSDSSVRFRYCEASQVPLQNSREVPPPLPRRVHLARIESARRCWLHAYRDADHAEGFNEALCRKFACVTAHPFVGQDSRTSVALCTACSALRAIPSLRSALTAFGGYVLIVCRFLYDIAPSAISSAELCLAYLWQPFCFPDCGGVGARRPTVGEARTSGQGR